MKRMPFIDRKEELSALKKEYEQEGGGMIIIFGRRRVGKTRLIGEFMKGEKGVYYLAADEKDTLQIRELQAILGTYLDDDLLSSLHFEGWKDFFRYLERSWPADKKQVLAIDEITYIIKNNPSFLSYLQQFWDRFLSGTETKLILSGSIVNMMVKEMMSSSSPLYGRRSMDIHLQPMGFVNAKEFMKGMNDEERIMVYSVLGGIPKYLLEAEPFEKLIKEKFFNQNGFFYREGLFLLSEEVRNPSTYSMALRAISEGKSTLKEISDFTGVDGKKMSAYLDVLISLGLIKREVPITSKGKRTRKGIYHISDNFLAFWYAFVHPNRSVIELNLGADLFSRKRNEINSFIARRFEDICRDAVRIQGWPLVGRWWGAHMEDGIKKEEEIDIMAVDERHSRILFGEVKWSSRPIGFSVVEDLLRKSELVQWRKEKRKEHFLVISKSGFTQSCMKKMDENGIIHWDLYNLIEVLERNLPKPN